MQENTHINSSKGSDTFFTQGDDLVDFTSDLPQSTSTPRQLLEQHKHQAEALLRPTNDPGRASIILENLHIKDIISEIAKTDNKKGKTTDKVRQKVEQWGSFLPDVIRTYVNKYYDLDDKYASTNTLNQYDLEYRVPEYSTEKLNTLISQSPVLAQCIEAMVSNVVGNGYTIGYRDNIINKREAESEPDVIKQKRYLKLLADNVNQEQSLYDLLQCVAKDFYNYGHFYVACRRNPSNRREILELIHIPAPYVRILKYEDDQTDKDKLYRGNSEVRTATKRSYKRYVTLTPKYDKDGTLIKEAEFFVELGSRKLIDSRTGIELPSDLAKSPMAALELFHGRVYDPTTSYGKPMWLNQLSAIVGQIEADSINLTNFTQNMIPQLLFLVSNMAVARNDLSNLEESLNSSRSTNSGRRRKAMVLRGVTSNPRIVDPEHSNIRDAGINVIKLNEAENKELMFGGYDKQCSDRIRSAFRLPPIVVGLTDDYNKATSTTSLKVAEQQVFALQRKFFEDIFNNKLLTDESGKPFGDVRIVLNLSSIEDKEDESIFLKTMSQVGALTPNMALTEYNKFTGHDYELFPEDWANRPIALSQIMLQQAFAAAGRGVEYDPVTGSVAASSNGGAGGNEKGRPNQKTDEPALIRGPYNKDGVPNDPL